MTETRDDEAVKASVVVPLPREDAFELFAHRLGAWWPPEYTFSGENFAGAEIDPTRWFERNKVGTETDWGRVRIWEPEQRIVAGWQIAADRGPEPDEAHASEVDVRFTDLDGLQTRVDVEHSGFSCHSTGGDMIREGMASEMGWPLILDRYRQAAEREGASPLG